MSTLNTEIVSNYIDHMTAGLIIDDGDLPLTHAHTHGHYFSAPSSSSFPIIDAYPYSFGYPPDAYQLTTINETPADPHPSWSNKCADYCPYWDTEHDNPFAAAHRLCLFLHIHTKNNHCSTFKT
jgi:hypothetical protein